MLKFDLGYNTLTGGGEVDLRGARVVGLLESVESAQNQPILMQAQAIRQRRIGFEVMIKNSDPLVVRL